jgi:hypothetical protein
MIFLDDMMCFEYSIDILMGCVHLDLLVGTPENCNISMKRDALILQIPSYESDSFVKSCGKFDTYISMNLKLGTLAGRIG